MKLTHKITHHNWGLKWGLPNLTPQTPLKVWDFRLCCFLALFVRNSNLALHLLNCCHLRRLDSHCSTSYECQVEGKMCEALLSFFVLTCSPHCTSVQGPLSPPSSLSTNLSQKCLGKFLHIEHASLKTDDMSIPPRSTCSSIRVKQKNVSALGKYNFQWAGGLDVTLWETPYSATFSLNAWYLFPLPAQIIVSLSASA